MYKKFIPFLETKEKKRIGSKVYKKINSIVFKKTTRYKNRSFDFSKKKKQKFEINNNLQRKKIKTNRSASTKSFFAFKASSTLATFGKQRILIIIIK